MVQKKAAILTAYIAACSPNLCLSGTVEVETLVLQGIWLLTKGCMQVKKRYEAPKLAGNDN